MKSRYIKERHIRKPFDLISWCGYDTKTELASYTPDSFLLNLIHKNEINACSKCLEIFNEIIHTRYESTIEKKNNEN